MSIGERIDELSAEIRNYPTPIARCDEQLTALIEQRNELFLNLEKECCSPDALWTNDGGFIHAA